MSQVPAEVRRHVISSYIEKLFVVVVAIAAFTGLLELGHATDDQKMQVNRDLLQRLEKTASKMRGDPTAQRTDALRQLDALAKNFAEDGKSPSVSPAEAAVQIEHLADEAVWDDYQTDIAGPATAQTVPTASKPSNSTASKAGKSGRDSDGLAAAEGRARGRIAAVHALIEAAMPHVQGEPKSIWKQMADEKSSLHVLYEIVWYSLLIIGVLACSYLLMTVFMALPFTSLDSHWTERLNEILKTGLPQGARMALTPLAAAALIGGTVIAGASYATVPGGVSRRYVEQVRNEFGGARIELSPATYNYPQTPNVTVDGINEGRIVSLVEGAKKDINTQTNSRADAIGHSLTDTRSVVTAAISKVATAVDNTKNEAQAAHELADKANGHAESADTHAQSANTHAESADTQAHGIASAIEVKSAAVSVEQERQDARQSHVLAQTAAADERGFWRRNFGFTMFKVGPGVIDAIDARMASEHCSDAERQQMRDVMKAMADHEDPASRWGFEAALDRHKLAPALKDRYFRTLLHLCELPR